MAAKAQAKMAWTRAVAAGLVAVAAAEVVAAAVAVAVSELAGE